MQCSCGGSTTPLVLNKQKNKRIIAVLEYDRCRGCGRVGNQRFYAVDLKKGIKTLLLVKH